MTSEVQEHIYRWPQVARITGLSRSTCWHLMKKGEFPNGVQLSTRTVGWKKSEIDQWIESRKA